MFLRIDKLQIDLPQPATADPNAAAALQELLGGKYGEMSTLGNYLFQNFNFRSKSKLRPFYSLVANITAEELGHVELVSSGVALVNNGPGEPESSGADISDAPFEAMKDIRLAASFLSNGGGATPVNSNGASWNVDHITTTGNVIFDCSIIFTWNAGHGCTSYASTRRFPMKRAGRFAGICSSAEGFMHMPMRWR